MDDLIEVAVLGAAAEAFAEELQAACLHLVGDIGVEVGVGVMLQAACLHLVRAVGVGVGL